MEIRYILFHVVVVGCLERISGDLSASLHYYETLHHSEISHHVSRRSVETSGLNYWQEKIISFRVLGKKFRLHLHEDQHIFARKFKLRTVKDGHEKPVFLNEENIYEGYIEGEALTSRVTGYKEGENFALHIHTQHETYSLEPSSRHLPGSNNYTMVAYRASDLKSEQERDPEHHLWRNFCGYVQGPTDGAAWRPENVSSHTPDSKHGSRTKRAAATSGHVCPVMLVADYRFFNGVGNGDLTTTANYIINVIQEVNAIYEKTTFGSITGMGLELKEMIIHQTPTVPAPGKQHYNMQATTWDINTLLKTFGAADWSAYCLAHLFTHTSFSGGVLGLGWIASPNLNEAGGVCSQSAVGGVHYNTAWSSTLNTAGHRLLSQESTLVTSHEFGHNWGSQHDPDTTTCAPSSGQGGKFLMYPISVSGYNQNNFLMSPCSQTGISKVLEAKSSKCFTPKSTSFCGNHIVEPGEDCDAGSPGRLGTDPCCDNTCFFRQPAQCSDANSACCSNCTFAAVTKLCRSSGNLVTSCKADAYCQGSGSTCPASGFKADGTSCIDGGKCMGGACLATCEYAGLVSCKCDAVADSCMLCCRANTGATCKPYAAGNITLAEGKTCTVGYCKGGVCVKSTQTSSVRLWSIINNINVNTILVFMKNNIVITTIVISLVFYIPFCMIVWCIDRRRKKDEDEQIDWHRGDNDKLVKKGEDRHIRSTYRRRRNPEHMYSIGTGPRS